jgi:hypothetical protein
MRTRDATPEQAEAALRAYCEKLARDAIIDDEFARRLGDADLVDHIIQMEVDNSMCSTLADLYPNGPITRAQAEANWAAKPEIERIMDQVGFCAPPHCYF